ncbi:TOBE domain-containing protein, partial [Streptomyces bacillaris]|uniref:TOBE domain-containing protein n=1 Tax=Streptomyces bacillaris TaxID=68179 RepID=UPI0036DC571F
LLDGVYHSTPAGATVDLGGVGTVGAAVGDATPGASVTVAVRPERVRVRAGSAGDGETAASLLDAVFLGDEWRYILRAADGAQLVATRPSRSSDDELTRLVPGDAVAVSWAADDARVLVS